MPSAHTQAGGEACTDGDRYEMEAIPDCHCMTLGRPHYLWVFCSSFLSTHPYPPLQNSDGSTYIPMMV